MTGRRHKGRDFTNRPPNDDHSRERSSSSPSRYRHNPGVPHRPRPGFGKPQTFTRSSGRPHPGDGTSDFGEDEEGEEEDQYQHQAAGPSNDNPLYELQDEDSRLPDPGQGSGPSNNPLYGNDPFEPPASRFVCMTEFLRPRDRPRTPKYNLITDIYNASSRSRSPAQEGTSSRSPLSPPVKLPRQAGGRGRSWQQTTVASPVRFSPLAPTAGPSLVGPQRQGLKTTKMNDLISQIPIPSTQSPAAQRQFNVQNIKDLIAAVRSDQTLHLGESRRDPSREPRIAGDHDRYFAPRKGDIIVHYNPTPGDNKLLEYFDQMKTMLHLQAGDKLVRIKYDNYKIPDHLMITAKLYIFWKEWIYLGKAVQTIKTA